MGRESRKLTAALVRQVKTPGVYYDGAGLLLRVEESGPNRWVLRVAVRRRRRDLGLGSASDLSLAEARDLAHQMRKAARAGLDPAAQRRTAREGVMTFQAAAEKVHVQRTSSWRNAKHSEQWINTSAHLRFPYNKAGSRLMKWPQVMLCACSCPFGWPSRKPPAGCVSACARYWTGLSQQGIAQRRLPMPQSLAVPAGRAKRARSGITRPYHGRRFRHSSRSARQP